MKCPLCNGNFPVHDTIPKFCPCENCGEQFSEEIREQLQKELDASIHPPNPPPAIEISSPESSPQKAARAENAAVPVPRPDPGATSKAEYRKLVKETFSSGNITLDKIRPLIRKKIELGIDDREAIEIQKAIGEELGLDVSASPDLLSGDLYLDVNIGKTYYVGERGYLEFRLNSISTEDIYLVSIKGRFAQIEKERDIELLEKRLAPEGSNSFLHLPFNAYNDPGEEPVYIRVVYQDIRKNPSVYMAQLQFRVFDRNQGSGDNRTSVTVTITGDRFIGCEFEKLVETIAGRDSKEQKEEEKSFHLAQKRQWQRLPLFFMEEETTRLRNDILIQKKWKEGNEQLGIARKLREEAERVPLHKQEASRNALKQTIDAFSAANACFFRIIEIDPEHGEARARIIEIEDNIAEVKRRRDDLLPIEKIPQVKLKLTSAALVIPRFQKKVFLYSKPVITLGRRISNDIVLKLLSEHPKEQHPKVLRESEQISRHHAEIVNNDGIFYLRDTGTDGQGSQWGTFLDSLRVGRYEKNHPLRDGCRINVAKVLDLGCNFIWKAGKKGQDYQKRTGCITVMGNISDSCFGIDKQGMVNAIRITRLNNFSGGEEYLILIREATIGRSVGNGIVINDDSVSDIHAKILYRDDRYWIEDLNSRHGTRIEGTIIPTGIEVPLDKQAAIAVGDISLNFTGRE